MSGVNRLIQYLDIMGWRMPVYNSILIINFLVQLIFLFIHRKRYEISVKQVCLIEMTLYPLSLLTMYILAWLNSGSWGGFNIVRIFVYIPLYALLTTKLVGVPSGKFVDFLAPSIMINKVIGHIACPFAGCCQGYACSWGIWNPHKDALLFPNQWLECIVSLAILILLLRYAKEKQYKGTGSVYALMLCMYGVARFFLEFLRDNEKLFLGISEMACHALFMVLVGTAWMLTLYEKEKEDKRKAETHQRKRRK